MVDLLEVEESVVIRTSRIMETLSKPPPLNIVELWKEHLKIREVLKIVGDLQNMISQINKKMREAERSPEVIKNFLNWSDKTKIARNNVEIVKSEVHGLELRATGPIPEHHIVVKVPRNAMITLDLAKKSSILKKAFERDPIVSGMGNVGLALFLAAQWINNTKSKWFPYVSILPTTFSTPLFYSEEQLLELKPSPVFEEALLFYRSIARQFAYFLIAIAKNRVFENEQKSKTVAERSMDTPTFYNTPFNITNFSPVLYFWAVGVVTTRVNMVPSETEKTDNGEVVMVPALIPFLDMANHENLGQNSEQPPELVCFSTEEQCAVITAHRNVDNGDAVTIFYGRRSNGEHLLHNGFVPIGDNLLDVLKIKIGIPKSDKNLEQKMKLIKEFVPFTWAMGNVYHFEITNFEPQPFSDDLISFAAIFVSSGERESLEDEETRRKAIDFLRARFELLEKSYGNDATFGGALDKIGFNGDVARLKKTEVEILQLARMKCEELLKKCGKS